MLLVLEPFSDVFSGEPYSFNDRVLQNLQNRVAEHVLRVLRPVFHQSVLSPPAPHSKGAQKPHPDVIPIDKGVSKEINVLQVAQTGQKNLEVIS